MKTVFHDFSISLEKNSADPDGYSVRVNRSLAGQGQGRFKIPERPVTEDELSPRQVGELNGQAVFEALFHGPIGELFRSSIDRLEAVRMVQEHEKRRRYLRVQIGIDLEDPDLAELVENVDWEMLFDSKNRRFLARSKVTTLVRDLKLPTPMMPLIPEPEIHILVFQAQPIGKQTLDLDRELQSIRRAWRKVKGARVEALRGSLDLLEERIFSDSEPPVHILHFAGHGEVCDVKCEGYLVFEKRDGEAQLVSGVDLVEALAGQQSLRLVVLNACETAKGPEDFPARGVAASLMRTGLPAVVATRRNIQDESAVSFAETFHKQLALGLEVDAAMAAARRATDQGDDTFEQWSIPVLFMSSGDGNILQLDGATSKNSKPERRLDLGVRSRMHPFIPMEKTTHFHLDLVPFFQGRDIRDFNDWQDKIEPYIDEFLRQRLTDDHRITLRLDAHLTICFAVGRSVDMRGIDPIIKQGGRGGFQDWALSDEPADRWKGPLWKEEQTDGPEALGNTSAGNALVIALSVTDSIQAKVEQYLETSGVKAGRMVSLTVAEGTGQTSIQGPEHAWALSEEVRKIIHGRSSEEEAEPVHLFLNCPGAMAYYLGRLSRGFGAIQLYEYGYEHGEKKTYAKSLLVDPKNSSRE